MSDINYYIDPEIKVNLKKSEENYLANEYC